MKFVGLVSGGKDSVYTICTLIDQGHELVGLINIKTDSYADSYMYQTVGSEIVALYGKCFGVPLFIFNSECRSLNLNLEYKKTENDEVEDLFKCLQDTRNKVEFEAVSSGAILSRYQKNRVKSVCERLGLISLAPLWMKDQEELLKEMILYGLDAKIIKVASSEFLKSCLNMTLDEIYEFLKNKNSKYPINFCGEGGEYESSVFDCKYFIYRIEANSFEIFDHPDNKTLGNQDGVFYLKYSDIKLSKKV